MTDSSATPDDSRAVARAGATLDYPLGWVYVLCLESPRRLRDADIPEHISVTHYVGFTAQNPPMRRPMSHGRGMASRVVLLIRGTMRTEELIKMRESCDSCGESLNYFAEARVRLGGDLEAGDLDDLARWAGAPARNAN